MFRKQLRHLLLAGVLSAGLLLTPALAAEDEPAGQQPSPWAVDALADSYALGMLDDNYSAYIQSPLTQEQLENLTGIAAAKLALLDLPQAEAAGSPLVVDTTRGGVMNALYQEAAAYQLPGVEEGAVSFLSALGVVQGDGAGLAADRPCTYEEAMVMAQRLVLAVYDQCGAGSKGLLWKVSSGDNTLYLLGTIHTDRSNLYPFHRSLRDAISAADTVIFEVDFNDAEGLAEFAALQVYNEDDSLENHIGADLYRDIVEIFATLDMDEETVSSYKPWTLLLSLNNLLMADESTGSNAMAVDTYVNSRAVNGGAAIEAVETYAFQGKIFDTLSPEYQEAGLAAAVALFQSSQGEAGQNLTEEEQAAAQAALDAQTATLDAMMEAWKNRDPDALAAAYDKAAIVESGDELNARLFTDRDPGMIEAAVRCLESEDAHTFFMAVGAGHMLEPGGIVPGLQALGYTVELVP